MDTRATMLRLLTYMGSLIKASISLPKTAVHALLAGTAVLFPGAALAADLNSVGITPPPDSDLSVQIIGSLTGLVDATAGPIAEATNVLGHLMSTWNASMMFVGSLIVGYILVMGVLQTAHQGEMLGRNWNSNTVPARATLGLAMTAPMMQGFSAIQLIVIWVALQGIGLADMMWSKTVDVLAKNGGFVTTPDVSQDAAKLVSQLYVNMACQVSVNREIANANAVVPTYAQGAAILPYQYGTQLSSSLSGAIKNMGKDYGIAFENRTPDGNGNLVFGDGFCGRFSWNLADAYIANEYANGATGYILQSYHDMGGQLIEQQRAALMAAYQQLYPLVEARFGAAASSTTVAGAAPTAAQLMPAARAYMKTVTDAAANMQAFMDKQGMASFGENASKDGWVMAGSYYSRIGHMNQAANDLIGSAPSGIGNAFEDESSYQGDLYKDVRINIAQAKADMDNIAKEMTPGSMKEAEALRGSGFGMIAHPFLAFQDKINQMMYASGDPVSRTQNIGHAMLDAWYAIKAISLAMDLIPAKKGMDAVGAVADSGGKGGGLLGMVTGGIMGVIDTITPLLLVGGIALAYVFPMIPFSLMLFGVMSWLTSFFIALVAAPLWAISHATPDGHDAFGSGVNGYILLMSVAIRPALTILAMIGSMGIMFGMDKVLSLGFTVGFAGAQVNSMTGPIGFVSGVALFAILSCILAYGSFRMVQTIPNAILEWIGGKDDDSLGVESHHGHFTAIAARFGSGVPGAAAAAGMGAKAGGGDRGSHGGGSGIGGSAKDQKDLSMGQVKKPGNF